MDNLPEDNLFSIDNIIAPPPIKKYTIRPKDREACAKGKKECESTVPLQKDAPMEYSIDESGELISKFLAFEGFTGSFIASYDNWIDNMLPEQLSMIKFDLPGGIMTFSDPSFISPREGVNSQGLLYPDKARSNLLNYSGKLFAKMKLTNKINGNEIGSAQVYFGEVPVMLGSKYDNLSGKTDMQLLELNECPRDPLGYFIVEGTEKIVLLNENLRTNRFFTFYDVKTSRTVTRMTAQTLLSTSIINIFELKPQKIQDKKIKDLDFEMLKPLHLSLYFLKGASINVFVPFELWGIDNTNDIIDMIMRYIPIENQKRARYKLEETAFEYESIPNILLYVLEKYEKDIGKIPEEEMADRVNKEFDKELYPQFSNNNKEDVVNLRLRKLEMLSIMVANHLLFLIGARSLDDRDSWSNKRIMTAGLTMERLFMTILKTAFTERINELFGKAPTLNIDDIKNRFPSKIVTETFSESFRSTGWGVRGRKLRENITDILNRDSLLSTYSHLGRVNAPASDKVKNPALRFVQNGQLGYICPIETPESSRCGLVKNLAIGCYVTIERSDQIFYTLLKINTKDSLVVDSSNNFHNTALIINGVFWGWVDGTFTQSFLIKSRRNGSLYRDTCIVLHKGVLYVYTDSARPTRPLLVVDENGELELKKKYPNNSWKDVPFERLVSEGIIEYIDAWEQESKNILIAQTIWDLESQLTDKLNLELKLESAENMGNIEEVDLIKQKLFDINIRTKYSHCELDPIGIFSVASSIIPMFNRIQGPRAVFQCKMGKQALGIYHSNSSNRFDTAIKTLSFPSRPLFESQINQMVGLSDMGYGQTLMVAIMPYYGFNQEDAIIINRQTLDNGALRILRTFSLKESESKDETFHEIFCRPTPKKNEDPVIYSQLDQSGVIRVGSYVKAGDVILGKVRVPAGKSCDNKDADNISIKLTIGEQGRVERVYRTTNSRGEIVYRIKIRDYRIPQEGDKFALRYAQKGTIGLILPPEDMPFISSGKDQGLIPDVIINPHSLPSRMTIAQLFEFVTGKYAVLSGERINATAFRPFDLDSFRQELFNRGYNPNGNETMINGRTGEQLKAQIFIGPAYYQALRHHVQDKIQMRSIGNIVPLTRAPTGGRTRRGAQKIGEMERDAFISHGASKIVQERLCEVSDVYSTVFCKNCGTISNSNLVVFNIECPRCHRKDFGRVTIPYSYKLLTQILIGAGIFIRLRFDYPITTLIENLSRLNNFSSTPSLITLSSLLCEISASRSLTREQKYQLLSPIDILLRSNVSSFASSNLLISSSPNNDLYNNYRSQIFQLLSSSGY